MLPGPNIITSIVKSTAINGDHLSWKTAVLAGCCTTLARTGVVNAEVYGANAPLQHSSVEPLHFQRFDDFWKMMLENPDLALCRDELLDAG